jgi:uncharacterized protein DUF4082/Big-like domain-containing protein
MTQITKQLTKSYATGLGVLIAFAVVSSILLASGCGMTTRPNIPSTPTPTPTPAPDTAPPTVTSFNPAPGANNVSIDTNVTVTFSETMDPATVNGTTVQLLDPTAAQITATVSYDATSRAATLNPNALLAAGVTYTVLVRGGGADPRAKDLAGNALASNASSTFTTAPIQVLSVTPREGADAIPAGVAPRAVFSAPLDPTTVNSSTVLLQDAMSNPVPAAVSYSASAFTIAIVPRGFLQPLQTYTVTLKGGAAPSITNSTGAPLPVDFTWSFTTAAAPPPVTGVSIWDDSVVPPTPIFPDSTPVELGLKFRSDKDGLITGVRFYKGGAANAGQHVGHLWTDTGLLLASVTFTDESDTGWQRALFETPVRITANTLYVVSYFAPAGNYAAQSRAFESSGVDSGPLHAPSDPVIGGNGVFNDNPSGGFPSKSFNATNYWVDVVFVDTEPLPPQVLSITPAPGAINVSTLITPAATFSKPLILMTVNSSTVLLTDTANKPVPITVFYNPVDFSVRLLLHEQLQPEQAYTVTFKGAASPTQPRIIDWMGIPLPSDYTWSFTTFADTELLPPQVLSTTPARDATDVPIDVTPTASFSKPLDPTSVNFTTVQMTNAMDNLVHCNVSYDASNFTVTLTPVQPLQPGQEYTVRLQGASPAPHITDEAGTPLEGSYTWSFTTESTPQSASTQVKMFGNRVSSGANFIALRPDNRFAPILGLNYAPFTLSRLLKPAM